MSNLLLLAVALWSGFSNPPRESRPWCYWYWVNGNVDRETIAADLTAMKRVGFGGVLLLDPRGYDKVVRKPEPKMQFGSPEWREMVVFSMRECARRGLEFTMNLSDCGGSLKGPWLTGKDGPKRLVCGVDADGVPAEYENYADIASFDVFVPADVDVKRGWRNAGGATGRWERDSETQEIKTVSPDEPGAKKVSLRFGYCLIPKREHDVDVIDSAAVERHWHGITDDLLREAGDLVGTTWTHVYSVSWEGAIPTWTDGFGEQFRRRVGYEIDRYLPVLAGFLPPHGTSGLEHAENVLKDYRRVRNLMFKDNFYGTIRRLAHEKGLKLYSESGGPWNRDPSVFREADQLAFLGMNDMPQGEFWIMRNGLHTEIEHSRPAANAAHVYGLKRASAEAFSHMDYHYAMYPAELKKYADVAFADGINHFVWHTFTCSPPEFGKPGIEYFAGTHLNPNVTWFNEADAFLLYLSRCQFMLQAGKPVADIAVYGGKTPYRHWGRYRHVPWDGARVAIPRGYCYDVLNDETLARKSAYSVFIDGTADIVSWPRLPLPDVEGEFDDFIHRRTDDGTDIYFVVSPKAATGDVVFRVSGKVAEFWDPVSGTRRIVSDARPTGDGRTRLRLRFPKDGSLFVVFRPKVSAAADLAPQHDWTMRRRILATCEAGWEIDIGGKPYGRLGDWTKSDDPEIRHFSGRASYRTTFALDELPCGDCALYLGRVAGGCARVLFNGYDCGVAWCWPFRVRVPSSALKVGINRLEVQVVNTWRNRLIGDCLLPEAERTTKTCLELSTGPRNDAVWEIGRMWKSKGYCADDEIEPCGLYGPVELTTSLSKETPPQTKNSYFIASNGSDSADGSLEHPFATVGRAQLEIRRLKAEGHFPKGGMTVFLRKGRYAMSHEMLFDERDSGEDCSPVVWCAYRGEKPVFDGGWRVPELKKVTDPSVLARIPKTARCHVLCCDVRTAGYLHCEAPEPYGAGCGILRRPITDLFADGEWLPPARHPNDRFLRADEGEDCSFIGNTSGLVPFAQERNLMACGYWQYLWRDMTLAIGSVDPVTGRMTAKGFPSPNLSQAGGKPYFLCNALCAIDSPGEWYIDSKMGMLYVWPPDGYRELVLSDFSGRFLSASRLHDVRFMGLTMEYGRLDAVKLDECHDVSFSRNSVRNFGRHGVIATGAWRMRMENNEFVGFGGRGVYVKGGDRRTLTSAENIVFGNDIAFSGRRVRTYAPGLEIGGCGTDVVRNRFHDMPSSAMRIEGNDHRIFSNMVERVVTESDDQGGIDIYRDPSYAGVQISFNTFRDVGTPSGADNIASHGQAAVRLDGNISGMEISSNLFERCGHASFGAVQINGGRNNRVEGNMFIDCTYGVSISYYPPAKWLSEMEKVRDLYEKTVDIHSPPYATRYSGIATLDKQTKQLNIVMGNTAVRTEPLVSTHSPDVVVRDNYTLP